MNSPLGLIRDRNPNEKAVAVYALILNNVVVNMILANYNDILAISKTYDYCVDVTMNGDPSAGIGHTYNASDDTFVAPPAPPIDWVENVREDFDNLISSLQQVVIDSGLQGGSLNAQQINAGYNSALNDNPNTDAATNTLLTSILQYVLAGG